MVLVRPRDVGLCPAPILPPPNTTGLAPYSTVLSKESTGTPVTVLALLEAIRKAIDELIQGSAAPVRLSLPSFCVRCIT